MFMPSKEAYYLMVNEEELQRLIKLNGQELRNKAYELMQTTPYYFMERLWEGLHFVLTGRAANEAPEGQDLRSEAVIGSHNPRKFWKYAAGPAMDYIEAGNLGNIIRAMRRVDAKKIAETGDYEGLAEKSIFEGHWTKERRSYYLGEIQRELTDLLNFYIKAKSKNKNIVIFFS